MKAVVCSGYIMEWVVSAQRCNYIVGRGRLMICCSFCRNYAPGFHKAYKLFVESSNGVLRLSGRNAGLKFNNLMHNVQWRFTL